MIMTNAFSKAALAACVALGFLVTPGASNAQYAGSNVTGTAGLIAVDKVGNKIRFYDPATLAEIKVIDQPLKAVHELAISYDHRKAYIPIYGDGVYLANRNPGNKIVVVDLQSKEIEGIIDLGINMAPHGIVATRSGMLWVVSDETNRLMLVNPATKTVVEDYAVPGIGSHFIAMLPDESKIYISNKQSGVAVFNVARREFVGTIPLSPTTGIGRGSESLTPTPDGKRLVVADNDENHLRIIDTMTDREVMKVPLRDRAPNPRVKLVKLMFSPDGKHLLATNYGAGQAWVIDGADLHNQVMLSVAKGPQGVAFAPDGRIALISSHDSGLVSRVDLVSKRVLEVLDGGTGIEVLAYY